MSSKTNKTSTDKRPRTLRDEACLITTRKGTEDIRNLPWLREVVCVAPSRTGLCGLHSPKDGELVAVMELDPSAPHSTKFGENRWERRGFVYDPDDSDVYNHETGDLPAEGVLSSTIVPGLPGGQTLKDALNRAQAMGIEAPDYGVEK